MIKFSFKEQVFLNKTLGMSPTHIDLYDNILTQCQRLTQSSPINNPMPLISSTAYYICKDIISKINKYKYDKQFELELLEVFVGEE